MTPIELAAVASAAVPGLNLTACAAEPDDAADFESALLHDSEGRRWRVRSPKHAEASTRLETELAVLRAFSPAVRAELPFLMPTVAGTVRQGALSTFVYSHLAGHSRSVETLAAGGAAVARELGSAMAAIHDLPPALVSNADLPSYTANEFRQRKLNELDQAATTGKIPAALLRRWEHALEDVALWRFSPSVVHGDLHEDNILLEGSRVMAVIGWTDLRVGDPADDFAWLVAVNDHAFVDAVQEAYSAARKDAPDRHLLRRAALSAEFALAQWLVKGVAADNAGMVAEAETMLRALEADIATYGGQPIATEPPVVAPPHSAAVTPVSMTDDGEAAGSASGERAPAAPANPAPAAGSTPVAEVSTPAVDSAEPAAEEPAPSDPPVAKAPAGSPENLDTTALTVIPLHK
ncbi:macrolide 2'-phosphotransferase [Arthrobacter sp. 35W]|uniref:macrolide 2'-phosphotransferase n=1 Tax=Arthrobacter sp. 35W TaxID=1132441 RepID=UPI00040FE956|nr:macrolide 2'-phosphotransferase [Arthrobacter sp. 35W]